MSSHPPIRFVLTLLILSTLLAACDRREAGLRQKLTGSWALTNGTGVITLAPDGSLRSRFTGRTQALAFEGTWQLRDDVLIVSGVKSNGVLQVGETRCKILHLEGGDLVWESGGQSIHLIRK